MPRSVEIRATKGDANLHTVGAVYTATHPPVLKTPDVDVMVSTNAKLSLRPGNYFYLFHVEAGAGKFSLALDGLEAVSSQDYDTAMSGKKGLTYSFVVM